LTTVSRPRAALRNLNGNISTTVSQELPEASAADEFTSTIQVSALNGSPTSGTFDVDIEMEIPGYNVGTTEQAYWARVQSRFLGRITSAQSSPVFTVGDFSLGTFQQVTNSTTLTSCETRGIEYLLGRRMRVTLRPSFVGGSSPSWTVSTIVTFKTRGDLGPR